MQIVSGNPTLKKGADGDSVRWHSHKSKVYFDASLDNAGKHAREAVQLGFGTWIGSGAKLPSLDFDSTKGAKFGQVPNGKSEVMYGPITLAGHENDLALTVTFSDPKTGEVVESDMIFNSKHPFGILPYVQAQTRKSTSADSTRRAAIRSTTCRALPPTKPDTSSAWARTSTASRPPCTTRPAAARRTSACCRAPTKRR